MDPGTERPKFGAHNVRKKKCQKLNVERLGGESNFGHIGCLCDRKPRDPGGVNCGTHKPCISDSDFVVALFVMGRRELLG